MGSDRSAARRVVDRPSAAARRVVAVAALCVVPWTVLVFDGSVDLVFLFGLVTPRPFHLVTVTDYLFRLAGGPTGLPRYLLAWPVSSLLAAAALASAVVDVVGRGDRRVTAGVLLLAGLDHLWFAVGVGAPGVLAVPVGPPLAVAVAWWAWPTGARERSH